MLYIICYKGKRLGKPMGLPEAEVYLNQLSRCFKDLEIVSWHPGEEGGVTTGQQKLG